MRNALFLALLFAATLAMAQSGPTVTVYKDPG